jgi:hypothetical protein
MNKTKLIPFDLERWRKADFKRVVTKSGKEVSELTYYKNIKYNHPLVGVLENEVESWAINGSFRTNQGFSELNLMLEVEDKTLEGWVNVFKDDFGPTVYSSKENAMEYYSRRSDYVTTIQITYNDNNI